MNPHRGVKVDIKDFYQTVRPRLVRDFFERDLKCAPDIAHLLSEICCAGSALPTGSALSPVLSYFACSHMFARIAALAGNNELVFTLYVDDMMFSGVAASRDFSARVVRELDAFGFVGHKISYFPPGTVKVVTGVAVWLDRVSLPKRRYKKIRLFKEAFLKTQSFEEAQLLGKTLIGQYREAERLHPGSRKHAGPIQDRLDSMAVSLYGSLTSVPVKPKKGLKKKLVLKRSADQFAAMRAQKLRGVA